MPDENKEETPRKSIVLCKDMWTWPEFQLFCERAGIPLDLRTQKLVLTIERDSALKVEQTYLPQGIKGGQSNA